MAEASVSKGITNLACVLTALAAKDAEVSRWVHDGQTMEPPEALRAFRRSLYECFHRRRDALFELADAILCADGTAPSLAHLSLQASHRRGWGSLYWWWPPTHTAKVGARPRCGPASAVGETLRRGSTDTGAGPSGSFVAFGGAGHASEGAETLR
jgi:hypothetical protein